MTGTGPRAGQTRLTIVSGGQTGVDRAALEVAGELGLAYDGWCPHGGWAEDLPRPPGVRTLFPGLRPTPSADPAQRTRWNVRDSDAALVLVPGRSGRTVDSPGTDLTLRTAAELGRPVLVAPLDDPDPIRSWLESLGSLSRLNVAGPRESEHPDIASRTRLLLTEILVSYSPVHAHADEERPGLDPGPGR